MNIQRESSSPSCMQALHALASDKPHEHTKPRHFCSGHAITHPMIACLQVKKVLDV